MPFEEGKGGTSKDYTQRARYSSRRKGICPRASRQEAEKSFCAELDPHREVYVVQLPTGFLLWPIQASREPVLPVSDRRYANWRVHPSLSDATEQLVDGFYASVRRVFVHDLRSER